MGDIAVYLFLFAIGISSLFIYQQRRSKTKHLRLSEQFYPDCILKILMRKKEGKPYLVIIRIMAKNELTLKNVQFELINSSRKIHVITLEDISDQFRIPPSLMQGKYFDLNIPYKDFLEILASSGFRFGTIRFSVENQKGGKYKSHELALNSKNNIYKPDSGKYN